MTGITADPYYEEDRKTSNDAINAHPALISTCTSVADVMAAVDFARNNSLPLTVRGGGRSFSGGGIRGEGLIIDLSPMKDVSVDMQRRTALVQAGATWGELDRETQKFGLAVTGGPFSSTGVVEHTLGGGSGWLQRKHGLTCDSLLSANVVTTGGRFLRASADENPELFRSLRGCGDFGVVTSLEYRLHPVGPIVLGGVLLYREEKAREVFRFYRDFMAGAPNDLGGGLVFLTAATAPFVPVELRGQRAVAIVVLYTGPTEEGERVIRPLRRLAALEADLVVPMPYTALQSILDEDHPPGLRCHSEAGSINEPPDEAIDAAVERAEHVSSELSEILFQPMGGKFATNSSNTAPARSNLPWRFQALSMWRDPSEDEAHAAWTRSFSEAMKPYSNSVPRLDFSGGEAEERVRPPYESARWTPEG